MIGVLGLSYYHPLLKFRLPFWFRGLFFGAWFKCVPAVLMAEMGGEGMPGAAG